MKVNLTEITSVIRSKNSGPYELTFDLIFLTREIFEKICASKQINASVICELYKIEQSDIVNIVEFIPANAIKITIKRPLCSGDLGETDVYGAQQHAPLLCLAVNID